MMKISHKLLYSVIGTALTALVIAFLPQAAIPTIQIDEPAIIIPYDVGQFIGRFLVIFGLALTFMYLIYFFYWLRNKQQKFPEGTVFTIGLILACLLTLGTQLTFNF